MATPEEIRKAQLDKRYQAKLAARASGKAPVFETESAVDGSGRTPEAIEARYRAKLARHGKVAPPAPAETKGEGKRSKGEKPGEAPEGDKVEAKAEAKPAPAETKGEASPPAPAPGGKPAR